MVISRTTRRGPKGISVETHNRIASLALSGVPASVAIEQARGWETPVSQTKVYEIYRYPVIRKESGE